MKTGFTKREKIMIMGASIFILVFLSFQYVIKPLNNQYIEKSEEYENLDVEKTLLDVALGNETAAYSNHENAEKTFNEIKTRYPLLMPNEKLDRILTEICLDNKLTPVTLGISDAVGFVPEKTEEENSSEETQKQDSAEEPEDAIVKSPVFSVVTATMTLKGDYNSLKSLIAAIDKMDYIRISRLSFSLSKDINNTDMPNVSVFFEITMLNDMQ